MLLFVYGSLRKGFHHPAYAYVSQHFDFLSDAKVRGELYDMGEYPAAVPSQEERFILGELYQLKPEAEWDWAIAQLDDYEGVAPEEGEPALYKREMTRVYCADGSGFEAWIYWYNGDITGKPAITSGDVLQYRRDKG
ncbi:gamma-glutamylcyclotransferase family protein [Flavihumibacter sp. UBA7668]|uniref:gamma-glutamylcyclotransferase family protein n=1 Tax=Flavihumibacter sp. UBA7668 TaxID=1946542 RepID=UPI0025BB0815|nr:gamma-glutamylcyclotransferase family protein [Flavihumibacter sp. UBA7668]